jgi:site-specific recombinase XerD
LNFFETRKKTLEDKGKDPCNCNSSKAALATFFKKNKYIDFREITSAKLEQFEKWMLETDRSISTSAVYTAEVRTLFNMAIKMQAIPEEIYPFGKNRYIIPQVKNNKRALKLNDIKNIYQYPTKPFSKLDFARDFWMFSYLGNGMNVADISRLKFKNIGKESFSFIRHKTKEKSKSLRTVTVVLTDDIKKIIEKWGNKDRSSENYVFPFLTEGLSPKQIRDRIRYKVAYINEGLEVIQKSLGIEMKLTTYSARHSFATTLKRSGVSREFISESLGHFNIDITQRYLDSFENEQRQEYAKHLTNF